jgi:hypothetical protein
MTGLYLCQDDPLERLLRRLGLYRDGRFRSFWHIPFVVPIVVFAGYLAPLALSAIGGRAWGAESRLAFVWDPNFPAQTLVCILLLLAGPLIDEHMYYAGTIFASSGLLADANDYEKAAAAAARLRRWAVPEVVAVALGFIFTAMWAVPVWYQGVETWQVSRASGYFGFTLAGWWSVLVFSPLFQYLWVRWVWKVSIWVYFLARMAGSRMRLAVGHPDHVGGLAFIGEVQVVFGILIFAMGIIIGADWLGQSMTGTEQGWRMALEVVAFVILAPLLFLLPLTMFTKKLYLAKTEGLAQYEILLTRFIHEVERIHLRKDQAGRSVLDETDDLADLSQIETLYGHVSDMRIVPFDLGSLGHLMFAAAAPMVPLMSRYVPWAEAREFIERIFGH